MHIQNFLKLFLVGLHGDCTISLIAQDMSPNWEAAEWEEEKGEARSPPPVKAPAPTSPIAACFLGKACSLTPSSRCFYSSFIVHLRIPTPFVVLRFLNHPNG